MFLAKSLSKKKPAPQAARSLVEPSMALSGSLQAAILAAAWRAAGPPAWRDGCASAARACRQPAAHWELGDPLRPCCS